jgi:hypothetical protein
VLRSPHAKKKGFFSRTVDSNVAQDLTLGRGRQYLEAINGAARRKPPKKLKNIVFILKQHDGTSDE